MRRWYAGSRGTAIAETSITLSFTLLVLYFAMELAMSGFYQLQLDGATFFFARIYAAGSTSANSINTALQPVFPNVPMNISPVTSTPPMTTVPVNFTQWDPSGLTQRYGGASILRPATIQTAKSITWTSLFGQPVKLTSGSVDGALMVANHDDDAQGVDYNSATANKTLENPLATDDQNVPPYYFNLAFMHVCTAKSNQDGWSNCPSGNPELHALGLGEFLKHDNYNVAANGIDSNGEFADGACHQRYFTAFAWLLPDTREAAEPIFGTGMPPGLAKKTPGAMLEQVFDSWDVDQIHSESMSDTPGSIYPLDPGQGC
ncbi:MAG TPA: hypothetical protein VGY57_10600 [Vicinamibacterales bacterium]|nr:hypothetical protein [Vicinamibacterales bacterium]